MPGMSYRSEEGLTLIHSSSCHENGSLSLLFMPISRHSQNILASESSSASISVSGLHPAASRPRVSLIGNVTVFKDIETAPDLEAVQSCYLAEHPDARKWVPGPKAPHIVSVHVCYRRWQLKRII